MPGAQIDDAIQNKNTDEKVKLKSENKNLVLM